MISSRKPRYRYLGFQRPTIVLSDEGVQIEKFPVPFTVRNGETVLNGGGGWFHVIELSPP